MKKNNEFSDLLDYEVPVIMDDNFKAQCSIKRYSIVGLSKTKIGHVKPVGILSKEIWGITQNDADKDGEVKVRTFGPTLLRIVYPENVTFLNHRIKKNDIINCIIQCVPDYPPSWKIVCLKFRTPLFGDKKEIKRLREIYEKNLVAKGIIDRRDRISL